MILIIYSKNKTGNACLVILRGIAPRFATLCWYTRYHAGAEQTQTLLRLLFPPVRFPLNSCIKIKTGKTSLFDVFGDPKGNRTPDSAVRGLRLNRLTMRA